MGLVGIIVVSHDYFIRCRKFGDYHCQDLKVSHQLCSSTRQRHNHRFDFSYFTDAGVGMKVCCGNGKDAVNSTQSIMVMSGIGEAALHLKAAPGPVANTKRTFKSSLDIEPRSNTYHLVEHSPRLYVLKPRCPPKDQSLEK